MVGVTVGAKVDHETKAKLQKYAGDNGKTVNEVLSDLIKEYIENHEKLANPNSLEATDKVEKLEIVPDDEEEIEIEDDRKTSADEEISVDEFYKEMWDGFREHAKERGYTLVKTDTLRKILKVLKRKKEELEDEYTCPACGHTEHKPFRYCPACGQGVEW